MIQFAAKRRVSDREKEEGRERVQVQFLGITVDTLAPFFRLFVCITNGTIVYTKCTHTRAHYTLGRQAGILYAHTQETQQQQPHAYAHACRHTQLTHTDKNKHTGVKDWHTQPYNTPARPRVYTLNRRPCVYLCYHIDYTVW